MSPIIVALDVSTYDEAKSLLDALDPKVCRVKIGKELFTAVGPQVIETIHAKGFELFLDLKFHDIPNTTAKAVKVAADHGVWMVNVHAQGGLGMMMAAKEALAHYNAPPLLIAVTMLTSMNTAAAHEIGLQGSSEEIVARLLALVARSELDGVVCSANEAPLVEQAYAGKLLTVCPGIRIEYRVPNDDQTRIMTPEQAISAGANYLVIGRPITQAQDPAQALEIILKRLDEQSSY